MPTDLDHLLASLPAQTRESARALAEEGLRQLDPAIRPAWIDGAAQLAARNLPIGALLAYLKLTPPVTRHGGAALQAQIVATALSIAIRIDGATVERFFTALVTATRRLITG